MVVYYYVLEQKAEVDVGSIEPPAPKPGAIMGGFFYKKITKHL